MDGPLDGRAIEALKVEHLTISIFFPTIAACPYIMMIHYVCVHKYRAMTPAIAGCATSVNRPLKRSRISKQNLINESSENLSLDCERNS